VRPAACVYSFEQAAEDRFRRICWVLMSVMVARGASRSSSGTCWAMPWGGRIVVRLVLGQDRAQMSFAKDQHAVQELTALALMISELARGRDQPVGCQESAWPVNCSDDQVGCAA
jgi:hypothetical protein